MSDRMRRRKKQAPEEAQSTTEKQKPLQPIFGEPVPARTAEPQHAESARRPPPSERRETEGTRQSSPEQKSSSSLSSSSSSSSRAEGSSGGRSSGARSSSGGGAGTASPGDVIRRKRRRGRGGRGRSQRSRGTPSTPLQGSHLSAGGGGASGSGASAGTVIADVPGSLVNEGAELDSQQRAGGVSEQRREHPAKKGVVVLAIGLPGSGKSTWFRRHSITPLSSDVIRTMLFDDVTQQKFQDLVFSTLRSLLRARLVARMPVNYVDATNLSPHERRGWIKMAHDFGYEVQAVYFDVPLEVCLERNHRRERVVSDEVMQRMAGKLRPPKFEEGFSKITVVRVKQKE
jgi:predicted kinase